jgi:hypothetical protein
MSPSLPRSATQVVGHLDQGEPAGAWFTLTEAAEATGKSRSTIKKYLADGKFPQARRGQQGGQPAWVIPLVDLLGAGLTPHAPRVEAGEAAQADGAGTQGAHLAEVEAELASLRVRAEVAEARAETAERLIRQQAEHLGDLRRALLMLGPGSPDTARPAPPSAPAQADPLPGPVKQRARRWPWQR